MVSINQLADIIAGIADYPVEKLHIPGPEGVRGRNSDNTLLRKVLNWEPEISLEDGLTRTYSWIEKQVKEKIASSSDKKTAIEELKTSRIFNSSCK